ncbi:tetratricopeptide repeat protein, partial [Myxococcota bacterium]|nr:tetratricopeptide repeat protein [Myxococcota bacterium]
MAINKEKIAAAAQKHFKKGNYDKALEEYQKIVKADPTETRYWKRIGDLQARGGDKKGAIETYLRIADDFLDKGFHTKALAILRQIQTLDSDIVEVYRKLSKIFIATNFMGDALHTLEQLTQILERNGDTEEMLATLAAMANIDPSKVIHRVHYAETLSRLNKKREAAKEFKQVATYLHGEKNDKDYVKVAERLLFHDPDDKETLRDLAEAYIRQKNPQKVLKRLLEIYQSYPGDLDNLHILARVFLAMTKREKAIQVYKEMARLLMEQGKRDQSNTIFERILEIDPRDRDALKGLGRLKEHRPPPKPRVEEPEVVELDADEVIEMEPEEVELDLDELEDVAEEEEDLKVIEESEAFFRYGLVDKSMGNLSRVHNQEHPRLLALKKDIYIKQAKKTEALSILQSLAAAYRDKEPEKALESAQEALLLQSGVDWADKIIGDMGSSMPDLKPMSTQEIASVLDLDDALDILDELSEAEVVLDISTLSTTGEIQTIGHEVHSNEEIDKVLSEKEKLTEPVQDDDDDVEMDLEQMLASLKGLTDESPYITTPQKPTGDLILGAPSISDGAIDGDLSLGLDELAELQEASQSFIRINELSKENIDIESLSGDYHAGHEMPDADQFIEFDIEETPVVLPGESARSTAAIGTAADHGTAPVQSGQKRKGDSGQTAAQSFVDPLGGDPYQMDLPEEHFLLDMDEAIPSANTPPRRKSKQEFGTEATMDNYELLMSFTDQLTNELEFNENAIDPLDEPTPVVSIEPEPRPEEEPPEDVTETFEEVEFFLEMALYQEAIDTLMELHSRFPLQVVKDFISRVASDGEIPNPLLASEEPPEPAQAESDEILAIPPTTPEEDLQSTEPILTEESPKADNAPTAVTTAAELLKDDEPSTADPGENMFEELSLDGMDDNLDLNFNEEESNSLEDLDLLQDNKGSISSNDQSRGVRIETEQPIGDAGTHLDLGIAY